MSITISDPYNVIMLDDEDLFLLLVQILSALGRGSASHQMQRATGAGFARGFRFHILKATYNILCLGKHTSQPFSYLTLGAFASQYQVSSVIAITGAHSLRHDLFPGDLAIVRRASALPYPALYENRDPYGPEPHAEHYDARPEVIEKYSRLLTSTAGQHLWQREIPEVTCAYARHPTWRGELMPWAPEQFQKLRNQGADTLSSTAVGIYEAHSLMSKAEIICINQVRSNPNADSAAQWKRFKRRLHGPVISLLQCLIHAGEKTQSTST